MNTADASTPTLLIVDAESYVRGLFKGWLGDESYECLEAQSAASAWAQLQTRSIALVALDIGMAGNSGLELLEKIQDRFPDSAVLLLAEEALRPKAIKLLSRGPCGYLVKPAERDEFLFHVRRALERRKLLIERREDALEFDRRVREQTEVVRRANEEVVHRLVAASTYRDEETSAHIRRTGLLSEVLAAAAGWSPADAETLRMAAPMHDLGKIGVPDSILQKPTALNTEEFETIKRHTVIGAEMLAGADSAVLQLAQTIALCHHEKWDGSGYPNNLRGANIPQAARIVAIVDVYDALTHDRVYRPALSESHALSLMLDGSGTHFDPALLELFVSILPEVRRICDENLDLPSDATTYQRAWRHEGIEPCSVIW